MLTTLLLIGCYCCVVNEQVEQKKNVLIAVDELGLKESDNVMKLINDRCLSACAQAAVCEFSDRSDPDTTLTGRFSQVCSCSGALWQEKFHFLD